MLDFRTNTFLTVCETMNFTEAAKKLNITQPAVSQHIRFLENEYNTQLFLYHNKQLYITQTGKVLKKRLMTMKNDQLSILEEMKRVVKKNHKVVFTGNFEHPLTIVSDDFVILEIFDITDRLNIYVEDKSRGSDYGD